MQWLAFHPLIFFNSAVKNELHGHKILQQRFESYVNLFSLCQTLTVILEFQLNPQD